MIAKMEKLVVAGPKSRSIQLLEALQKAGVVHLDTLRTPELAQYRLSPDEEARLKGWEQVVGAVDQVFGILDLTPQASRPFTGSLEEARSKVDDWAYKAEVLGKERQALRDEIEVIHQFQAVAESFAAQAHGLDRSPYLMASPFLLAREAELPALEEALKAALQDRYLLSHATVDKSLAVVVIALRRDAELLRGALSRLGISELRFPGAYGSLSLREAATRMAARVRTAPEDLHSNAEQLKKLSGSTREAMLGYWTRARDEAARLRALSDLAGGRFGFAMVGWLPASQKQDVESALSQLKDQVVFAFEPADEHHEAEVIPVTLTNPGWARPFEMLHTFLNTPRYGGYDPTLSIAIFFPFYLGLVVGDMGVALLFALAASWMGRLAREGKSLEISFLGATLVPKVLSSLSQIIWWMVAWTMVFGFIYGEFFGTFLEKLKIPGLGGTIFYPNDGAHDGLIPILINRLDIAGTSNLLIAVTLVFGVFQVLYAFGIKAYLAYRHHHMTHFWEAFGYLSGLIGLVALAYGFQTGVSSPILTGITVVGLLGFVVAVAITRMWLMIPELPSKGGQILSYIRLYAVGMAGAVLMSLANQAGFALANSFGFVGAVMGVVVAVIMMSMILAITTLGHVLQPIRLMWIEFSTNLGFFEESGRAYRPFKSVRND